MFMVVRTVAHIFTTVLEMVNHICRPICAVCSTQYSPQVQAVPRIPLLSAPPVQRIFLTTLVFLIILLPQVLH
jgi:hypothetical protein